MMKVRFNVRGIVPMLHRNARLADPTDRYTVKMKEMTDKRKKTVDDMVRIMYLEARGSVWETEAGTLAVPASHLRQSIIEAARGSRNGKKVEQGLTYGLDQTIVELALPPDMGAVNAEEFCGQRENILYVSVKVGQSRVMRARPIIPAGWTASYDMSLDPAILDLHRLREYVTDAGLRIGLGDWRPGKSGGQYGKFEAEVIAL